MTQRSGDPVPSIAEVDATGEIAELYADIRESLGMPFVNLVWRNLASVPGGLKWAWTTSSPMASTTSATPRPSIISSDIRFSLLIDHTVCNEDESGAQAGRSQSRVMMAREC